MFCGEVLGFRISLLLNNIMFCGKVQRFRRLLLKEREVTRQCFYRSTCIILSSCLFLSTWNGRRAGWWTRPPSWWGGPTRSSTALSAGTPDQIEMELVRKERRCIPALLGKYDRLTQLTDSRAYRQVSLPIRFKTTRSDQAIVCRFEDGRTEKGTILKRDKNN